MVRRALVARPAPAHALLMAIDLSEWESHLERLAVTRAPHRLGGRVIWIAARPQDETPAAAAVDAVEPLRLVS